MRSFVFLLFWTGCLTVLKAQTHTDVAKERRYYVGLNITNMLGNFVGNGSDAISADPYLLSLRVGSERRRWRFGANFRVENDEGFIGVTQSDLERRSLQFRAGIEWGRRIAPRFDWYGGFDLLYESSMERSLVIFGPGAGSARLKSKQYGLGGGPFMGVMWRIHDRVILSTETNVYTLHRWGKETVNAPPDVRQQPFNETLIQPVLPTSLFIHFLF